MGAMTNHFLSWYLEEKTDYFCDPERYGSERERFDVEVYQSSNKENRVANIFIKRMSTSKNLGNYMQEFESKKDSLPNSPANICLNLVFSAEENSDRLKGLLDRYGYMSDKIENSCFSDEDVFMTVTPAVTTSSESSFTALSEIKEHLESYFDIP